MPRKRTRRSDRLLDTLRRFGRVAVITHDTPDPDAIAAGWALHELVRARLDLPVRLIGGGAIMRAENVRMVRLLRPPLELVNDYTPAPDCAAVLVDCSPEAANHLLGDGAVRPVGVIDHHRRARSPVRLACRDIRPRAVAAATITGTYLREQGLEPSRELATALIYAVRTEMPARQTAFSRADRRIVSWLAERADYQALSEIENAPLPRRYFEDLTLGLGSTFLYGDCAVCFLPQAEGAEIVGEIADLLIRCTDVHRVLCGAMADGSLVVSARTSPTGGDAVRLLSLTLKGLGHWGGHATRAGGKVVGENGQRRVTQQMLDDVKARWLQACGVAEVRGARLIMRRDVQRIL